MKPAPLLFLGASLRGVDDMNPLCASNIYIIIFCYAGNIHLSQRNSPFSASYIFLFALRR